MVRNDVFSWWLQVLLAVLLLARPAVSPAADEPLPATVVAIDIMVDEEITGDQEWPALARALLGFETGDRLTAEALQNGLGNLATLARVDHGLSAVSGGVRLSLELQPFKRIKSITIQDNYPLFDKDVANALTVAPGDLFRPEEMPAQAELIQQRFVSEGYIDPQVRITWQKDPEDGHFHLTVDIDKGSYYQRGAIHIAGNQAFSDDRLQRRLSDWRNITGLFGGDRFIDRDFEESIKDLRTFYRKAGYAEVAIESDVTRDAAARRVDMRIDIHEGPHYTIGFKGNDFFSDFRLRKELAIIDLGNRGNIGLRRSIHQIRERYVHSGFADVAVRWEEHSVADREMPRRQVTLIIDEGPRYIVDEVHLRGNTALPDETIREQMLTRPPRPLDDGAFAADVLAEDVNAIRSLYLSHGFLDAHISVETRIDPRTHLVSIDVNIQEGVRTEIGRIEILGETPLSNDRLRQALPFQEGDPYQPYLMQSAADALAAQLSPLGYPHVRVPRDVNLSPDGTTARLRFTIEKGPLVRVGPIFFIGNFKTRETVMARELGFESEERFSLAEVLTAQRNLRNLGLFTAVQIRTIGLKEKADSVPMLIEVKENEPYYFEIGTGYQTDKGPYLRSRVGDRNFQGRDQEVWTGGEVSQVGYRWDAGLSNPRLLGSRIRADLGVFAQRQALFNQEFGTRSSGGSILFSRGLGPRLATSLGGRYEYREQFLRDGDTEEDEEALDPRSIFVTTPAIRYDSRDSFIQPRKGLVSSLSVDISTGLENALDNFLRYKFDMRYFYSPLDRLTLASLARVGYLTAYGDNSDVPQDQLFFLGGIADVRGFQENMLRFDADDNPVGGRLALNGSLEARYDVGRNVEISTFVDAGSLRETFTATEGDDDFRWSAGLGLRYVTPIGPVGVIYGHKINPLPDESPGQFHFTIGYTF